MKGQLVFVTELPGELLQGITRTLVVSLLASIVGGNASSLPSGQSRCHRRQQLTR